MLRSISIFDLAFRDWRFEKEEKGVELREFHIRSLQSPHGGKGLGSHFVWIFQLRDVKESQQNLDDVIRRRPLTRHVQAKSIISSGSGLALDEMSSGVGKFWQIEFYALKKGLQTFVEICKKQNQD